MAKFREVFGKESSSGVHMSNEDFQIVPYFFSGMPYKTVSYLTGLSVATLRVRKTRIKNRILSLNDVYNKEKQLFLNNL